MCSKSLRDIVIGFDFDNTIVDYRQAFFHEAVSLGLIDSSFSGDKLAIRDALRGRGEEMSWRRLQGRVYGAQIGLGRMTTGLEGVLDQLRSYGVRTLIVSHKTQFGHFDETRVDLRLAALGWLREHGFFDHFGFSTSDVHFCSTLDEKVDRIAALRPSVFIDDLPEVLESERFPECVLPVLYGGAETLDERVRVCPDWKAVWRVLREGVL